MANFKTCVNGHNYDASQYAVCPYCPPNTGGPDYEKTLLDFKNTMINEENADFKTTLDLTSGGTQHPFKRTSIVMDENSGASEPLQQTQKRKLVGWLVTFTNDDYGQDFKLYVGKNKVGSAPGCDILVNDSSISGEHTTILFRDHEFLIKDNFSTNGTKINGAMVDEGKLNDGDELKLGNTSFKFKTVF